jgi:AcrR family transcriptional regulator
MAAGKARSRSLTDGRVLGYRASMPRRTAPTRRRAANSTRDVILDAAGRRFAERGFAGVSVREIAADAGLKNQASLYHHFRDKRALYEAVVARGVEPIVTMVAASRADPGAEGDDTFFVDRLVDYLAAHPHLPRLIQRAALEDRRHLPSTVAKLLRPLYTEGLRVLADWSEGGWEAADLLHLGAGLYNLIFGYFANAPLIESVTGRDPLGAAAVARQRRFLMMALARLLGGPPPRRSDGSRRPGG